MHRRVVSQFECGTVAAATVGRADTGWKARATQRRELEQEENSQNRWILRCFRRNAARACCQTPPSSARVWKRLLFQPLVPRRGTRIARKQWLQFTALRATFKLRHRPISGASASSRPGPPGRSKTQLLAPRLPNSTCSPAKQAHTRPRDDPRPPWSGRRGTAGERETIRCRAARSHS